MLRFQRCRDVWEIGISCSTESCRNGEAIPERKNLKQRILLSSNIQCQNRQESTCRKTHANCANIQIKDEGAIMDLDLKEAEKAYGCLFCITGKENLVANCIQIYSKDVRARAANQTMRHTYQGVTKLQNDVILKGYVFFETNADASIDGLLPPNDILSVLSYSDGDWRLYGDDLEYAKWIFKYNGVLPLSKAYKIGDRIYIIDGPLKDLEGSITRIDKRNRSGQITLNFAGREQKVWLGFDIVKEFDGYDEAIGTSSSYIKIEASS